MKYFTLIIFFSITFSFPVYAQQATLWDSISLNLNRHPTDICNDTLHHVGYLYGAFDKVGNDSCNVVMMDSAGFTLLPPAPVYVYNGATAAMYHQKLYLGGNNLAVWNGSDWDTLAGCRGITKLYPHNGKLYACGFFDSIDGIPAAGIAYWNDTTWTAVPGLDTFLNGQTSLIYGILWYKNELYVNGSLSLQDSSKILNLIRFDGQHWTDVDGQMKGNQSPGINDMLVWKDTLFVCGSFRENNGAAGNGIAKWDGQHWYPLLQGLEEGDQPTVNDIMVFHNQLYAAGWFWTINGMDRHIPGKSTGLAKWDGTKWCALGAVGNGTILNLGQFNDSLYVMGQFDTLNNMPVHLIAKWVGGDYTDSCSSAQTTGISPTEQSEAGHVLSLYPNPVRNELNIAFYTKQVTGEKILIKLTDMTGKSIDRQQQKINFGTNVFHYNTHKLPPGMYFLTINNAGKISSAKFVKR